MQYWKQNPKPYANLVGESRKAYLHPYLRSVLLSEGCQAILDYGCGDGALFEAGESLAQEIHLYDTSERMLRLAREQFAGREGARFLSDIAEAPTGYYDAVVLCLVLMTVSSIEEQEQILGEIRRVKKPDALVLIAITHPCFRHCEFSTFSTQYTFSKEFPYLQDGVTFEVMLSDEVGRTQVRFTDYHWKLSTTMNILVTAGLKIERLDEIPDQSIAGSMHNPFFPGYLVIHCR